MCGISGSGKTFYAREFEQEGYIRLSTDNLIWEKVGAELYGLSKEKQKELFTLCNQEIRSNLRRLLKSGHKVVLDATNCKRSVRNEIRNLCAEVNVNPIFVYCFADKEILWKRLLLRKGDSPDDLIVSKDQFSEYWQGFERPEDDETDFIYQDTNTLEILKNK